MRLVILPFALINSSVSIMACTLAVHFVVQPRPFVLGAIGQNLAASAVAYALKPLAEVIGAVSSKTEAKAVLLLLNHLTDIHRTCLGGHGGEFALCLLKKELNVAGKTLKFIGHLCRIVPAYFTRLSQT